MRELAFTRLADQFQNFSDLSIGAHRNQIAKDKLIIPSNKISIVAFASANFVEDAVEPILIFIIWEAV
jgi:hypothetical protein